MQRVFMALLIAPMVGVVAGDIVCAVAFSWGVGLFTLFGAMAAYPVVLVIGIPIFFILRSLGLLRLPVVMVAGVVLAVAGWSLVLWPLSGPSFDLHAATYGVFAVVAGLTGSLTFWALGMAGRDKDDQLQP
jgi:hypothetical protein